MAKKSDSIKHSILGTSDTRKVAVSVEEWGHPSGLFVRSLNILEGIDFEKAKATIEDPKVVALYVAYTLCGEDDQLIFDPATDVDSLCGKDPQVLLRVFEAAIALNNGTGPKGDDSLEKS